MRYDGYYWINIGKDGWVVGEYYQNNWYLTGAEEKFPERFIKKIDEKQIKKLE